MSKISLTSFERLSLSMQLRRLAAEDPDIPHYAEHAEIIEEGYTSLYGEVFGSTAEPEMSEAVQEEVFEILNMFRALHPGHEAGSSWDPSGDEYYRKFRGFDGNDGDGHYGFARFFIKKMGRFEESDGELNSHGPTLNIYRSMLARWQAIGRPFEMTPAQIAEVIGQ